MPESRPGAEPGPPAPVEIPEGWLGALLEEPGPVRSLSACERLLAPQGHSAFRVDAHLDPGQERVLVGSRGLVLVDAHCERVLSSHTLAPFDPSEPTGFMGPTFEGAAWTRLSDEERAHLHATDAVGAGVEMRLGLLPGHGTAHPTLVVVFEGWTRGARRGYHAVFVRCYRAGACGRLDLAHVELTAAGSGPCEPYRVARDDGLDTPLLWIARPHVGVLELRQLSLERRAGRDCSSAPDGPRLWRTVTWDGAGATIHTTPR